MSEKKVKVVDCARVEELGVVSVLYKQAIGNVIGDVINVYVEQYWAKY